MGKNKQVELSFDFFNLSGSGSKCSDSGYVEFGNGDSFSDSIQRFCGSEKPSALTSEGSDMWIRFVANGKTKYPGFKASYKSKG